MDDAGSGATGIVVRSVVTNGCRIKTDEVGDGPLRDDTPVGRPDPPSRRGRHVPHRFLEGQDSLMTDVVGEDPGERSPPPWMGVGTTRMPSLPTVCWGSPRMVRTFSSLPTSTMQLLPSRSLTSRSKYNCAAGTPSAAADSATDRPTWRASVASLTPLTTMVDQSTGMPW